MMGVTRSTLTLSIAQLEDRDTILGWANDPQVRRASFHTGEITEHEHASWFATMLSDPDSRIWILKKKDVPCGMVRAERANGIVTLSYSVAASHRRKGMSIPMLKLALEEMGKIWPNGKVVAWTRSNNIASIRALEKVHFQREIMEKERVRFEIILNG